MPRSFATAPRRAPSPRPRAAPRRRAPSPRPTLVSRCGRARCPHRAAAPHRPRWLTAAVRGFASHYPLCRAPSPLAPPRSLPRRAPHYPLSRRCRPAITHAHYPGGAMGTSRPTAITPAQFARPRPVPAPLAAGPPATDRRGSRTRLAPAHRPTYLRRSMVPRRSLSRRTVKMPSPVKRAGRLAALY